MLRKGLIALMVVVMSFSISIAAAQQTEDNTKLKHLVDEQFKDYCSNLETMTNIDSGTGDVEGSAQMASFLKDKLEALGGTVELRSDDKGTYVIGRVKGEGTLRILLLAHTDTVWPKGEAAKRPFRIDENTMRAYGPGAFDDKSVVAQTISLVKTLNDLDYHKYGEIILYYSAAEEKNSAHSKEIIAELAQQSDVCFVMDTAKPDWGVVTQRKGIASYKMMVEGRSSHAGTPTRGANAIRELNNQLSMLYKLSNQPMVDPLTMTPEALKAKGIVDCGQFIPPNTINVGVISTPNKTNNTIPDKAFAEFEVRFYQIAEGERLDREIKALAAKTIVPGTKVTITGGLGSYPMEKNSQVQKIVDIYKGIVKREYNADIVEWSSGGLTDGNFSSKYVPTIDSVGVEGYDAHTVREYADLNSVGPRTVALILLIQNLVENGIH